MGNYFIEEEKLEIFEYMKYGVKQNLGEDYSFYDKYDQIYKKYKQDLNWAIQSCDGKTKDDDYEKAAWLMATILEEPIVADQKVNAKIVIDVGLKMIFSAENTIYIKEKTIRI